MHTASYKVENSAQANRSR